VEICTPYAGSAGMLLHINGKFTQEKEIKRYLERQGQFLTRDSQEKRKEASPIL